MSGYSGWELNQLDRERLLVKFPPAYPDIIAHHVTFLLGGEVAPPQALIKVVGVADDGIGVQALVVSVDGETVRDDGKTYHVTWSIDREAGRRSMQSNEVIAEFGYTAVPVQWVRTRARCFV